MKKSFPSEVQMIPIRQIDVINPRARDQKEFNAIVANISEVGLKKPITVTPRRHTNPHRF